MRRTMFQGMVATVGGLGAFAALFFMVLGPLISTPSPTGSVLLAALGYPLLLAASAVAGVFRFRSGLLLAGGALACVAVVLVSYAGGESIGEFLPFALVIAAPAILQVALCGLALRFAAR